MKPSPKRWQYWEKFELGNGLIREYCEREDDLTYVDVGKVMLKGNGQVKTDIFKRDRLHMNAAGYELWTELIKPLVSEQLQIQAP